MADTYKFPGGYDVTVVRKKDIIDCIDNNIVDKEVALAIVEQCEIDAIKFLANGRWTGIPFIGNIRPSKVSLALKSKESLELLDAAKDNLTNNEYIAFKRELAYDAHRRVKAQRYYHYVLASAVNRNKQLFKKLVKEKGEGYARIHFFLSRSIVAVNNYYSDIENGEEIND